MKNLIFSLIITFSLFGCKSKTSDEKTGIADSTGHPTPEVEEETKTIKLMFWEYQEGDYAKLVFRDRDTKEKYDFGHPDENNLDSTEIVLKNSEAPFGYIGNDKHRGNTYIITMHKKLVSTHDDNGQPIQAKRWRIQSIARSYSAD